MAQTWTIRGGRVLDLAPFFVVGILNATPDSFYDGGKHYALDDALAAGRAMAISGAAMVDVGGESTRPGADEVGQEEEIRRVIPVIQALAREFDETGPVLSVDTYKAETARRALDAGALVVNDVSACRFDPGLMEVLAEEKPGYVLMHSLGRPGEMQKDPRYDNVVDDILAFFEERLAALQQIGLPEENIVLDPGVGFGKTLEHNLDILRGAERFLSLGRPLYFGISNKSVWGALLDLGPDERHNATQAATAFLAMKGVAVHRVHDVLSTRQTLDVIRALASHT